MSKAALLKRHRKEILALAEKHGAFNIRIFGSVAEGNDTGGSDIDFLVDMHPGQSLMDLVGLQLDLEELLNCSVDVRTEKGISHFFREDVIHSAVAL